MIINGEFRRLWKEAIVALRYCPDISLKKLKKLTSPYNTDQSYTATFLFCLFNKQFI
jgi:hypothetical protein